MQSETNENELRKKRVDDDTNEVPSQPTPRPVVDVRSISDDVVMASVAKGLIDVNDVNNEQVNYFHNFSIPYNICLQYF